MTVSFDTLSFAKRLTEAGEKPEVAEAHAMAFKELALKECVMDVIATKADLRALGRSLSEEIADVRDELQEVRLDIAALRKDARAGFDRPRGESALREHIDATAAKLTLRWAVILAIAVGAMATLSKMM